jgi:hypothetical protein
MLIYNSQVEHDKQNHNMIRFADKCESCLLKSFYMEEAGLTDAELEARTEEKEAEDYGSGYISEEHDRSAARSERLQDNLDEIAYEFGG